MSLVLALAFLQRGARMSFDVNWPPLCQSMVRQQKQQWSVVSGWKKCDGDVRKL